LEDTISPPRELRSHDTLVCALLDFADPLKVREKWHEVEPRRRLVAQTPQFVARCLDPCFLVVVICHDRPPKALSHSLDRPSTPWDSAVPLPSHQVSRPTAPKMQ